MPFTLGHPLAALVLRRTGLPLAGMVAGTIAPDLPMFLPQHVGYSYTHSPAGIVTADLVTSVVGVAGWVWLVRDALVDSAPGPVRERFSPTARYSSRQWALVPIAAAVGSSTHVAWDEFTHADRWGDRHVVRLHAEHWGWAGYHWAQAVSSVAGLTIVVLWSIVAVLRLPRSRRAARVAELAERASWVIAAVAVAAGGVAGLSQLDAGLHAAAIGAAVAGTAALTGAVLVVSVAWQLLARRGTCSPSHPSTARGDGSGRSLAPRGPLTVQSGTMLCVDAFLEGLAWARSVCRRCRRPPNLRPGTPDPLELHLELA